MANKFGGYGVKPGIAVVWKISHCLHCAEMHHAHASYKGSVTGYCQLIRLGTELMLGFGEHPEELGFLCITFVVNSH